MSLTLDSAKVVCSATIEHETPIMIKHMIEKLSVHVSIIENLNRCDIVQNSAFVNLAVEYYLM